MGFDRRYAVVVVGLLAVSGTARASGPVLQSTWGSAFASSSSQAGWITADGLETIALPPCDPGHNNCDPNTPRMVWLFGDTGVRDSNGQGYLPNNSIAVQVGQSGEPPVRGSNLRFYASAWEPGIPGVQTGAFEPWDATSSIPVYSSYTSSTWADPMGGWILTGQEQDPSLDKPLTQWIWPASGVYVPGTPGKLVIFTEPNLCFGPAATAQDYKPCRDWTDPPAAFLGERLAIIPNPGTLTMGWSPSTTDLGTVSHFPSGNIPYVRWGVAALFDDPYIYIYGMASENDIATHDVNETGTVVVASTTYADIGNFGNWQFLMNNLTWQQGMPAQFSDLLPIAHTTANVFSVSKVTYNGMSRYVMVDSIISGVKPTAATVIRTSSTPILWPDYAAPAADPALDYPILTRKDASGNVVPAGLWVQIISTPAVDSTFSSYASYGAQGHPELRNSGATGTVPNSSLLFSYSAPSNPTKFVSNPLTSMYPWCAKGADNNGDGIGDDVSACVYCGNGVRDPGEDCDPSAPAASRFDPRLDLNKNGKVDCSDVGDLDYWTKFGNFNASTSTSIACTSACTRDPTPCLSSLQCTSDAQCGDGTYCECYPSVDACKCTNTGWTPWTSRDTPAGSGDYEKVSDYVSANLVCAHPTGISCRRISDQLDWSQTGEDASCDTSYGFKCVNSYQANGHSCSDYEVSFYCAPTRWFNRDTPNGSGDYEKLSDLQATNDACAHPTGIECQRVSDGLDYTQTNEDVTCDPSYGLKCVNAYQANGQCSDYQVRFYCGD